MASISPVGDALAGASHPFLVQPSAASSNSSASQSVSSTTQTAQAAATTSSNTAALGTTAQPLTVIFDALETAGFNSSIDETLSAPPAAQASGAFSIFMDQLLAALAAQQTADEQAQTAAASAAASASALQQASAPRQAAATEAVATAAFERNSASTTTPNSTLENSVQALAGQVQTAAGATNATSTSAATDATLLPLQQSFENLVGGAGGTVDPNGLPNFLQAFASNLHTATSPLGNLVDSTT